MPEVVAGSGLLVPPRDAAALRNALQALMAAPERRAQLGTAAQHRIDELSWPEIIARHEQLYQDVINAKEAV